MRVEATAMFGRCSNVGTPSCDSENCLATRWCRVRYLRVSESVNNSAGTSRHALAIVHKPRIAVSAHRVRLN